MDKTPIAVALERQIPEYIRGEYELFVKFVKAYYEFLEQTQQRNLEDIRSIENTLDEFVIRFKKELSVLFPTNTLANERFILQRIREFYQARGSKESYQFLFRILFNKDSDVFYPSTQILRASDGKWVQEKSLFVKTSSGNLFNLTGKIINIKTQNKEIHVFCPRVVYYRDDVYEVFIDRAYVQDISVDNLVKSQDGNDFGYIIPCPNKYTIVSEGSGFEVGSLYYLKTEKGDGSLIKVTKIGTGGSIKKVQVINFGLDYESTFYAKVSNKQSTAVPYRHPVKLYPNQPDVPASFTEELTNSYYNILIKPDAYSDGTTGYVDLGYISKQDYFYYDKFYPQAVANDQNVFYADGTYVGEVIGSFYTNASNETVIDDTTAEIKIELGAVAIYPGYYSASDGFISDECFIQDGKYYQLFSYVIRVEQQIDSYYNIVKELMHPAGMELYAEYTIKNQYLVAAAPLLAFIRRQFLEQQFVTDDEATNEIYKAQTDAIQSVHSYHLDIKDVTQLKFDSVTPPDFNYYDANKPIDILDAIVSTQFTRINDITLVKFDAVDEPDQQYDEFTRGTVNESVTTPQSPHLFELSGASWTDEIVMLDAMEPVRYPKYVDVIYMGSYFSGGIQYPDADAYSQIISYFRYPEDAIITVESGRDWYISSITGGTFDDNTNSVDSTPLRSANNLKTETINNINTGTLYANPYSQEGLSVYDYFATDYGVADTRALS